MQTFLPYADFQKTFKVLDAKRLGKQRVEAMQIYNVLTGKQTTKGWHNHPAVLMWKGYEDALAVYHDCCIFEWVNRDYNNSMKLLIFCDEFVEEGKLPKMPWWLGNEDMHRSHRSRLIEKRPEFYEPLFPNDKAFNEGKYFWPVNETKTFKII